MLKIKHCGFSIKKTWKKVQQAEDKHEQRERTTEQSVQKTQGSKEFESSTETNKVSLQVPEEWKKEVAFKNKH